MDELIEKIKKKSKYINFPITMTSDITDITYSIIKIDEFNIYYKKQISNKFTNLSHSNIKDWNIRFLIQLDKLLEEKISNENIWKD